MHGTTRWGERRERPDADAAILCLCFGSINPPNQDSCSIQGENWKLYIVNSKIVAVAHHREEREDEGEAPKAQNRRHTRPRCRALSLLFLSSPPLAGSPSPCRCLPFCPLSVAAATMQRRPSPTPGRSVTGVCRRHVPISVARAPRWSFMLGP